MSKVFQRHFHWIFAMSAWLGLGAGPTVGQSAAGGKAASFKTLLFGGQSKKSIPSKFNLGTDKFGLRWECRNNGTVFSANTNVTALELVMNDQSFSPTEVSQVGNGHIRFIGKTADGIAIQRDLLLDPELGAVREYTEFTNSNDKALETNAIWKISYEGYNWQSLLNEKEQPLPMNTMASKEEENIAVILPQNDGNQPACFLYEGTKDAPQQGTYAVENESKLQITYALKLEPKQKKAFMRWTALRFGSGEMAKDFVKNVAKGGSPRAVEVPAEGLALLVNMVVKQANKLPNDMAGSLILLNNLALRSGIERGDEDIVWMGDNSFLAGELQESSILLQTRSGEVKLPLAEVAGIQGGAGRGKVPRIYLRDGSVFTGTGKMEGGTFKTRDGWNLEIDLQKVDRLFLKMSEKDGHAPEGTKVYFHMADGQMIPALSVEGGQLPLATPWGELKVAPEEIAQLWSVREPVPTSLVKLKDGSLFQALLGGEELKITSAHGGGIITVNGGEILAMMATDVKPEAELPDVEDAFNKAITSLFQLKGNNLFAGTFATAEFKMNIAGNSAVIQSDDIERITPDKDSSDDSQKQPSFLIKLRSGQTLQGTPVEPVFLLKIGGAIWPVAPAHLLGYTNVKPPSSEKPADPKPPTKPVENGGDDEEASVIIKG